jgi:hypothetical protein
MLSGKGQSKLKLCGNGNESKPLPGGEQEAPAPARILRGVGPGGRTAGSSGAGLGSVDSNAITSLSHSELSLRPRPEVNPDLSQPDSLLTCLHVVDHVTPADDIVTVNHEVDDVRCMSMIYLGLACGAHPMFAPHVLSPATPADCAAWAVDCSALVYWCSAAAVAAVVVPVRPAAAVAAATRVW